MSVAIRKRSWEEHVTQRMGLLLHPDAPTPTCHHGLVADSLHTGMNKEGARPGGHQQRWASLPDCCQASELANCSEQLLRNVPREFGNDICDGEEGLLSLEASTETLVHVSDESDTEMKLAAGTHWTSKDRETAGQWTLNGTATFVNKPPDSEEDQELSRSLGALGIAGEPSKESSLMEESRKKEDWDPNGETGELGSDLRVNRVRQSPKADFSETLSANEILPEKQLLHSAVIAQQRRKCADTIKDRNERLAGEALQEGISASHCPGRTHLQPKDSEICLREPPCFLHPQDKSGVTHSHSISQNKHPTDAGSREGITFEHGTPPVTTGELCVGQVTLREKKEVREDRGRGRLDSMALLIMKLDQLDRDIENALSTSSSSASPQGHQQQQRPILDQESRDESGENGRPLSQDQVDLPPNLESVSLGTGLASISPTTSSATKPKATIVPSASEKGKADKMVAKERPEIPRRKDNQGRYSPLREKVPNEPGNEQHLP